MTAPINPNARVPLDFYETPAWQTRALFSRVNIRGLCYEPCVGNGAILRASESDAGLSRAWVTNDLDPLWPADTHIDATLPAAWDIDRPDWVVSNFPFGVATPIVEHAHRVALVGVAVLLRLSWLEPTADRRDFLQAHPPDLLIVLPRVRYNPNSKSTDSVTTAWMVWYAKANHNGPRGVIVHPTKGKP